MFLVIWFSGYFDFWLFGFLVILIFGYLVIWFSGYFHFWLFGFLVFRFSKPTEYHYIERPDLKAKIISQSIPNSRASNSNLDQIHGFVQICCVRPGLG